MNKKIKLVLFFAVLSFITIPSMIHPSMNEAHAQLNTANTVKLDIQVYDVDLSTDVAKINITISFLNLKTPESQIVGAVISGENQVVTVQCNNTGIAQGSSGVLDWVLSGDLGKGEYAPFEVYELRFEIKQILGVQSKLNMSDFVIDREVNSASFSGSKEKMLSQIFGTVSNKPPFWLRTFGSQETIFYLARKVGAYGLPVLFWQLIIPTLACFLLLASTVLLTERKDLGHKLTIFLALFIFGPTFFMAIQDYLPLRAGLSIPEVLLINLIVNTAFFTGMSLIQANSRLKQLLRDGIMLFSSFFISSQILSLLMPDFPITALPVFTIAISLYSIIAISAWNHGLYREVGKPPRNITSEICGIWGTFLVDGGFLFAGWSFGQLTTFISGFTLGVLGIILFGLGLRIKKNAQLSERNRASQGIDM